MKKAVTWLLCAVLAAPVLQVSAQDADKSAEKKKPTRAEVREKRRAEREERRAERREKREAAREARRNKNKAAEEK